KVRPDGTVKVLDFGLARAMEPTGTAPASQTTSPTITRPAHLREGYGGQAMTQAGIILGTAAYMSPEQAKGHAVDRRTDVFAFACVLYECLTGRRAFEGETITETLAAVIHKQPDWTLLPSSAPSSVRRVLERCFQKDRKRRMRDIGDVALELGDEGRGDLEPVTQESRPIRWAFLVPFVLLLATGFYLAGVWSSNSLQGLPETRWIGERLGGPAVARSPVASPVDSRIAFAGWSGEQLPQVWVMEPGVSGGARQLTADPSRGGVWNLAWSRDGSRIFYSHYGTRTPAIWSVSAVGEPDPRRELDDATAPRPLSNGDLLAVRISDERIPQLIRYRPGSGDPEVLPVLLTNALLEQAVRVLPDEREAVVLGRPEGSNPDALHLWAIDLETYQTRRIAPGVTLPPVRWTFPLAVDRDDVYFIRRRRDLYEIVAAPLDGTQGVRPVLTVTGRPLFIDVGSDGSLYLDQIDQPTEILRIETDTGAIDRLPLASDQEWIQPLPDDRFLLASNEGEQDRLMVVARGGSPVPFLNIDEEARGPLVRVGADAVAFVIGPPEMQQLATATVDGRLQHRIPIQGSPISGLSASPDGGVLYYVFDGMIYRVPSTGGPSAPVYPGDQVAVDPSTGELLVLAGEGEVRLFRVAPEERRESVLAVDSGEWWLPDASSQSFTGGAVSADGRAVARIAGPRSGYWPVGVFDARSGGTVVLPTDPTQFDMYSASWDREGRLVMLIHPFRSELWRFRAEPPE
ncbi:MAG TPA: protein kinase, partial [Longimicrobiales bacterium]|nr:protein kinase [Longimicrobiales bacterium]